jgi:hypothetical protein
LFKLEMLALYGRTVAYVLIAEDEAPNELVAITAHETMYIEVFSPSPKTEDK